MESSVNFDLLKGFDSLDHVVEVFVPSTVDVNSAASSELVESMTNRTRFELSRMFGGCTMVAGVGSWFSPSAGLVSEPVNICSSNCSLEALNENLPEVIRIAKYLCKNMSQECISLKVDGRLFFIS